MWLVLVGVVPPRGKGSVELGTGGSVRDGVGVSLLLICFAVRESREGARPGEGGRSCGRFCPLG